MSFPHYFTNISVNILPNNKKMDISNSIWKGFLKKIQDGMFSPLGPRMPKKGKAQHVTIPPLIFLNVH